MKIDTTSPTKNAAYFNLDPATGASVDHIIARRKIKDPSSDLEEETSTAENRLTQQILQEGNGRALIKLCRDLAVVIIRRFATEDDAGELREKVAAGLVTTLNCTARQAHCLIDLSLELIHAKVHGKYSRTNLELSYLIATATGAVEDVASN